MGTEVEHLVDKNILPTNVWKSQKSKKDALIVFSVIAHSLLKCTTDHQTFFCFLQTYETGRLHSIRLI